VKKIVFITPDDAKYGFSLAGSVQYTIKEEELEETLTTIMGDPETGLAVIDERMIQGIGAEKLRDMEERWYGILLVLPAPEKVGVVVEDYALRLIRRAIGYHVRLNL
jgi:vacuolar-type H+-ATPase subunit F/Vma7